MRKMKKHAEKHVFERIRDRRDTEVASCKTTDMTNNTLNN
jgi:hypothetical protein